MKTRKQTEAHSGLGVPNPLSASCPSRLLLDALATKWALLVIGRLRQSPHRPAALRREIQGVSQKVLTQTLRGLERRGLVDRRDTHELPRKVEYALTPLGESLAQALEPLDAWVVAHAFDSIEEKPGAPVTGFSKADA